MTGSAKPRQIVASLAPSSSSGPGDHRDRRLLDGFPVMSSAFFVPGIGGRGRGARQTEPEVGSSSAAVVGAEEEEMWQTNFRGRDSVETGPYPERPGELDCSYYMRTGQCRFGMTCKFNHPSNRKLAVATARMKGEYPQRTGQPECQYYLKTGTCKFGVTCKFHHPKDKAGSSAQVELNILGFPLRPGENECGYYLRTGQCKFGSTCKFHHPQPSNSTFTLRGSPFYVAAQSPTSPGQQSYSGSLMNWALSKNSFIPNTRWQGPSSYAQLILPQGVVQISGWNPYSSQLGSSTEEHQQTGTTTQYYTNTDHAETATMGEQGIYSCYPTGSMPFGLYAVQRENIFPERPGQPECQFYLKTGDCKFGAVCKFHHPKERLVPAPNCTLSPLGLPLRPGEHVCNFYSRYGICKFGPNCKFDHPMGPFMYSIAVSPTSDVPTVHRLLRSSSRTSEGFPDNGIGRSRRLSISDAPQMPPNDSDDERGVS